jgi:protein-tyrosine phosphatase
VYLSPRPDATPEQSTRLTAGNRDGRYMAVLAQDQRPYFLLRDQVDGSATRVAERLLPLEHASNFRDLGGYPAANGKHVRWGLIYRSGATALLSDHDVVYLRTLGIHSIIDLRSTEERQLAPTRLVGENIDYLATDYPFRTLPRPYVDVLTALAPQYRALFRELLRHRGPVNYNCTAGQDRTGIATALVLSALGVPRDIILQDYHLSTLYRRPQNEVPPIDLAQHPNDPVAAYFAKVPGSTPAPLYTESGRSFLADMFDQLDKRWGSVDSYLAQVLQIGPADIAQLRAEYLE